MVHFTCDLCGKDLTASGDPRYVVKIEAYAGFDPTEITEDDLDDDHMEAVSQLLQRDEGLTAAGNRSPGQQRASASTSAPPATVKFLKDPLGREYLRSFDFSKN